VIFIAVLIKTIVLQSVPSIHRMNSIAPMNNFDYTSLDGRLLRMFISVYEHQSVTKAADSLKVTQSTVSHGLNQLRKIVKDELFVASGRSIAPTPKATELINHAREIVIAMQTFASPQQYDPSTDTNAFTVAANDYEIETIIKPMFHRFQKEAPMSSLHIAPARTQLQWASLLRTGNVDLVLSPELTSNESDLVQTKVLSDEDVCFYNPLKQRAPKTIEQYCEMPHAIMSFGQSHQTEIDTLLHKLGKRRRVVASTPSFASIASLIKETNIIATMPARLAESIFEDFEQAPLPFELPPFNIVKVWHNRNKQSQRHSWFKDLMK
jgi:DNA-binding transcriptional LysR family regulator